MSKTIPPIFAGAGLPPMEPDFLIAGPWPPNLPGSVQHRCAECWAECGVIGASLKILARWPHVRVLCMRCGCKAAGIDLDELMANAQFVPPDVPDPDE